MGSRRWGAGSDEQEVSSRKWGAEQKVRSRSSSTIRGRSTIGSSSNIWGHRISWRIRSIIMSSRSSRSKRRSQVRGEPEVAGIPWIAGAVGVSGVGGAGVAGVAEVEGVTGVTGVTGIKLFVPRIAVWLLQFYVLMENLCYCKFVFWKSIYFKLCLVFKHIHQYLLFWSNLIYSHIANMKFSYILSLCKYYIVKDKIC